MIKPLQNANVAFRANEMGTTTVKSPILSQLIETSKVSQNPPAALNVPLKTDKVEKAPVEEVEKNAEKSVEPQEKPVQKEKPAKVKKEKVPFKEKWVNVLKKTNKFFKTLAGSVKGVLFAIPTMYATAIVGKNIQENVKGGSFGDAVCGVFGDVGDTFKTIGKLFSKTTKSDHAKNINNAIGYFKNAKIAAAATVLVGAGVIAYNVIKSKIKANRQNSDMDHTFYTNHKIR